MGFNGYQQQTPYIQQNNMGYNNYKPIQQTYGNWNALNQNTPQVRPVSSIDEVRACPIDFDGSVFYFPDLGNRKIYTKQINADGTASIFMYELKEIPTQQPETALNSNNFITREEFENAMVQIKNSLLSISSVKEEPVKETKGVVNF